MTSTKCPICGMVWSINSPALWLAFLTHKDGHSVAQDVCQIVVEEKREILARFSLDS